MKRIYTIDTLALKIWGMIESSALKNRETFRQGVLDSIVKALEMQDATIEFVGYRPDEKGVRQLIDCTIYEDCVFISVNLYSNGFTAHDNNLPETIIADFIKAFEDGTHHHIE